MESKLVTEAELAALQYAEDQARALRQKANTIAQELGIVFNDKPGYALPKIRFDVTDDKTYIANMESGFGHGRLKLAFSLEQGPLLGWLILQREDIDELDRPMWTPVFSFSFSADEQWFGVGDVAPLFPDTV
jgi:hypothetical protein